MRRMSPLVATFFMLMFVACSQNGHEKTSQAAIEGEAQAPKSAAKVTFVELGSVNCVPCRAMQPVMKAIEKKYGEQVRVIFYDVWTPEQKKYAAIYGIKLIPTQVFLDAHGKELMRHEGFFAEKDIDAFLQSQGLKVLQGS